MGTNSTSLHFNQTVPQGNDRRLIVALQESTPETEISHEA